VSLPQDLECRSEVVLLATTLSHLQFEAEFGLEEDVLAVCRRLGIVQLTQPTADLIHVHQPAHRGAQTCTVKTLKTPAYKEHRVIKS